MAGRAIEPGVSLLNAGEIRVAVLPVGPVPRDVLDEYLELINRYHHVSLSATRSFYRESPQAQQALAAAAAGVAGSSKPPLQLMDWSNSYMHLKFLQSEEARRRTRLPDLHPGRRVLAILGVVYCPMCASVQQAYDEFKKLCRSYPEAFVTRCFVFEPSEEHIRQERDCHQLPDLVMFPPGGPSHLEQHLEVWMHDLAAALLTEFEKWMLTATPGHMKLSGYADSAEFTGASAVLDEMQKRLAAVDGEMREKQRRGRLLKIKGDLCLMCGSPRDAAEHYRAAQEISKACSDWVWYGVALEGIAAARIHEVICGSGAAGPAAGAGAGGLDSVSAGDTGGSGSSMATAGGGGRAGGGGGGGGKAASGRARDSGRWAGGGGGGSGFMTPAKWDMLRRSDAEALVRECFSDARAAYKRKGGVAALQIEQRFKLARLVAGLRCGGGSSDGGVAAAAARREVSELVGSVSELLPALAAAEDRLVATVECGQLLGMVGYARKRTLLLWHAMEQARAASAPGVGTTDKGDMLRIAVRALEPPDDPTVQDPDDLPKTHWSLSRVAVRRQELGAGIATHGSGFASRGWEAVQTVVLEAALAAAKQAHAPAEAWEAAAALLREHHAILTPQYQAVLLETLSQASAALTTRQRTRPGLGPGPLVQLKRLLPAAPPLQPTPLALTAAGMIAGGAGGVGRGKAGGSGPFIFNPYAAKRRAKQEAWEANATPDWACNDEGRVEVYLVNPLAVPLKIDQLQLHVKYLGIQQPAAAQGTAAAGGCGSSSNVAGQQHGGGGGGAAPTSLTRNVSGRQPAAAGGGGAYGSGSSASGNATPLPHSGGSVAAKPFRTPSLNLVLPPNGRPHRVVLCGKPQLPGTYGIEGCLVTSWGATWHVPFTVPIKKLAVAAMAAAAAGTRGGVGGGRAATAAGGGGRTARINVLPPLPLVKAIVRASPWPGPQAPPPPPTATPAGPTSLPPHTSSHAGRWSGSGQHAPAPIPPPGVQQHLPPHQQQQQQPLAPSLHPSLQQQQQQAPAGAMSDPVIVAVSPRDDDIQATSAHTAFSEDLARSPPVSVFEGQRLMWSLSLHNAGSLPVTALSVGVTNHKGVVLKPLRGAPLPASFQGVHLEVDDSALLQPAPASACASDSTGTGVTVSSSPPKAVPAPASPAGPRYSATGEGCSAATTASGRSGALPLRPSGCVTLPLILAVGQAPRGAFREVSVEVTISYLSKPPDRAAAAADITDVGAPLSLLGRRMTLSLTFDIQPSLSVASTAFFDHFAPLRNGGRLPLDRPIDSRVGGGGGSSSLGGGTGGVCVLDYDSDGAADGMSSRSTSMVGAEYGMGFPGGGSRPRLGSSFSRSSLAAAGPGGALLLPHGLAAALGGGGGGPGGGGLQQPQLSCSGVGGTTLSSRLAGLDLSLSGSRSARVSNPLSVLSSLTSPLSPLAEKPSGWLGAATDSRDGAGAALGVASLTPQGSVASQSEGISAAVSPRAVAAAAVSGDAAAATVAPASAAAQRASAATRSAMVTADGPADALGLVTDSVLCVALCNTSSYYFRAWMARLDQAAGLPLTAAAAAADFAVEVLQPGDTARLTCVLHSAAHTALSAAPQAANVDAEAAARPDAAVETDRSSCMTVAAVGIPASALTGMSSLRCVRLTGGGSAGETGGAEGWLAAARLSGDSEAGGGAIDLPEEADRMAAAEALAEEWAVAWELVVGLSEVAAGRAPPRGLVRLAAVDIARSMSSSAVQCIRPSPIHFQFQALPPAFPAAGAVPRLKDLTYRLQALGLLPQNIAGAVWGLRTQLGELLRLELIIQNRSNHPHHLTFSVAASPSAAVAAAAGGAALPPGDFGGVSHGYFSHHAHQLQQQQQRPSYGYQAHGYGTSSFGYSGAPLSHSHPASFKGGVPQPSVGGLLYGVPDVRHNSHLNRHLRTADGYTTAGSFVLGSSNPSTSYGNSSTAMYGRGSAGGGVPAELYGSASAGGGVAAALVASSLELGIDPGVVLVGAVQNIHMTVEPRSMASHPLALTFVHPGLYQLYVYDVCVVPQGVDEQLAGGRQAAERTPQQQRIYASVDRMVVLCV